MTPLGLTLPWRRGSVRLVGAALIAVAIGGGIVARRTGTYLGADTAPFFRSELRPDPSHPWWPLPTLIASLAVALGLLRARTLPGWAFAAGAFVLALGSRLGLAVGQRGIAEWWWPLTRPGALRDEYPHSYALVGRDPLGFVDHFAELVPRLPVHPSGHPVGATLAFWALDRVAGGSHGSAIALCALGAASVLPLLALGRALVGDGAARVAVVLFALAPSTLIYGATSYDAAFVLVTTTCAWLLVTRRSAAGGALAAVAFLLSYALALAPLWAALTLARRGGVRAALWAGGAALAALGLLAVALGHDPIHAVLATHDAYERGIGGRRPQWYWVVGGPAAFLVVLGPFLAERFLTGVERSTPGARALAACLLLGALTGVVEAEVERILQFLVPFAAIAAAPLVRSRRWLALGLLLALAEAYLIELRRDATF